MYERIAFLGCLTLWLSPWAAAASLSLPSPDRYVAADLAVEATPTGITPYNILQVQMPYAQWSFMDSALVRLYDSTGVLLGEAPSASRPGYRFALFRSATNPFSAFNGSPTYLADLSFMTDEAITIELRIHTIPSLPLEMTTAPMFYVAGGIQAGENIFHWDTAESVIHSNAAIVPEPSAGALLFSPILLLACRRGGRVSANTGTLPFSSPHSTNCGKCLALGIS